MQRRVLVVAISVLSAVAPAYGSQKGPKAPHQPSTPYAQSAHSTGAPPKATKPPAPVKASSKVTAKASIKTTTKVPAKSAKPATKTTTKTTTKTAAKTAAKGSTKKTSSGTATTSTPGTPSTIALSPVQQKLQRNTQLAAKLQGRLPAGTDLTTAAGGFRNLGQFVAAVNVSNNLGLPFSELKTRMVTEHMSLGQAIQDLRPGTGTQTIARRAEIDADATIRSTETAPTTTTATKTKTKSTVKARSTGGGN